MNIRKQLIVTLIVYIGQMLVGFGLGWSAPLISKLKDPEQTPLPDVLTDFETSWIGSVLYIGTIIGPFVSGFLSNERGRRICLMLGGILTTFSFLLLATSVNLAMILTGRIFTGLGTGIIAVINMVYIGEIASTNIRGMLLTGIGIFGTLGTLMVYSIGPYFRYAVTSYVDFCLSAIYVGALFFIPETPMFYILKGREEKAKDTLILLGREDEIDTLLSTKLDKEQSQNQWRDVFFIRSNRKALFITFTLGILQQMSGIIAVLFFATTIFEMAGSSIEPNIATIVIGITQLFSSSITPFFVERNGRKVLLAISTTMCSLSLAVLGTYFYLDHLNLAVVQSIQWLPMVTLILFFLSYDMGFGIIPSTFIGEMFQSSARSSGSTLTNTSGWLFGFGVSTAFGYMITALGGHVTFWLYSAACLLATLFTVFFVPETKGKTFQEIQEMLSR